MKEVEDIMMEDEELKEDFEEVKQSNTQDPMKKDEEIMFIDTRSRR